MEDSKKDPLEAPERPVREVWEVPRKVPRTLVAHLRTASDVLSAAATTRRPGVGAENVPESRLEMQGG